MNTCCSNVDYVVPSNCSVTPGTIKTMVIGPAVYVIYEDLPEKVTPTPRIIKYRQ